MQNKRKIIDLFCGMGGFRLAFESFGCECVFSSDIDENVRKTYELNFNEVPVGDITEVKSDSIPQFDILCAGFPCQPFSIAGKRLGFEDTRGTLFFEVARIIKDKQPEAFLLENVKGLVNHDKGQTLNVIIQTLNELGYYVEYKVLNAIKYGVPQNRERWYCIGINKNSKYYNSEKKIKWPNEIELGYNLSDIIEKNDNIEYKVSKICINNIKKFIDIKKVNVTDTTLAYEIRPSRCQFSSNKISPCLTAKMGTGGNNVPVVVNQGRKLTEIECLKIMGYPAEYKVYPGYHTYKQIGNSVVVPVLTKLAGSILDYLK